MQLLECCNAWVLECSPYRGQIFPLTSTCQREQCNTTVRGEKKVQEYSEPEAVSSLRNLYEDAAALFYWTSLILHVFWPMSEFNFIQWAVERCIIVCVCVFICVTVCANAFLTLSLRGCVWEPFLHVCLCVYVLGLCVPEPAHQSWDPAIHWYTLRLTPSSREITSLAQTCRLSTTDQRHKPKCLQWCCGTDCSQIYSTTLDDNFYIIRSIKSTGTHMSRSAILVKKNKCDLRKEAWPFEGSVGNEVVRDSFCFFCASTG